jgi:hypothetical protein
MKVATRMASRRVALALELLIPSDMNSLIEPGKKLGLVILSLNPQAIQEMFCQFLCHRLPPSVNCRTWSRSLVARSNQCTSPEGLAHG